MRHTTPTCQAHAQPTGKARPNKAGATRQAQGEPTAALADREAFLTEFSLAERLQLSETAKRRRGRLPGKPREIARPAGLDLLKAGFRAARERHAGGSPKDRFGAGTARTADRFPPGGQSGRGGKP
mgnify:CR=1 FL=1